MLIILLFISIHAVYSASESSGDCNLDSLSLMLDSKNDLCQPMSAFLCENITDNFEVVTGSDGVKEIKYVPRYQIWKIVAIYSEGGDAAKPSRSLRQFIYNDAKLPEPVLERIRCGDEGKFYYGSDNFPIHYLAIFAMPRIQNSNFTIMWSIDSPGSYGF